VLPLTNPLRVAEEAATVDHISKGRFDFGIGRSGLTRYYEGYNVPYAESRSRFLEALEIIMKAWREESFSHEGDYHSFHDVTVTPKPFQQPYPPVRVAVAGEDTFPLVGAMGHPIFISANTGREALRERLSAYREKLAGSDAVGPPDIAIRVPVYCAETTEMAHEEPRVSALGAIQYAATELIQSAANPEIAERMLRIAAAPYEQVLEERVLFGTPAQIVDTFKDYQEHLGVTGVVMEVNYGGQIPADRVVNSLRLISNEVMPHFK
jgi:alkanesulfonate monooxygenase SsuD/methylene tetrahydromethanopterin reductase-like flavin-dependent oxidoreductase (luciferase family)